jgi:hypothetical protein
MPTDIATLLWILGGGLISLLLALVAWFVVRLVQGLDDFKQAVTGSIHELSESMHSIHKDLGERVRVIEVAGCINHRRKEDV